MSELHCSNCRQPIPEGVHPYTIRIEIFPRVEESLEYAAEDLEVDFDEELKKIVEQLEAMDEEERRLQDERIYSGFTFVLCRECRDLLARQLRRNISPT